MRLHTGWHIARVVAVAWALALAGGTAHAQNWSFDAREIALGGAGNGGDIAASMIQEQQDYRAIVLPFGLLQVVPNWYVFNPSDDRFDPVRAGEYAASPIHYIVGRDATGSGQQFVSDVRNATLSRDLNAYRGFVPAARLQEAGLASATWGGTIKFAKRDDGSFQGIYIGGGPYLSTQTSTVVDEGLRTLLASETPVVAPNATYRIDDETTTQLAASIVGGYRARFALANVGGERSGLYLAANYRYLRGFRLEDFGLGLRLDTDRAGLLTINPAAAPLAISRIHATSGSGAAIDVGVGAVLDHVEFGFGINGIGNHLDWTNAERTSFTISSLLSGGEFVESPTVPVGEVRVELPVDYRGHAAYRSDTWSASVEAGRNIQGNIVRGGVERWIGSVALRGGARYVRQRWEPRGGVGFNFSPRVGLDVTGFSTSANLERKRHLAIATSIRIMTGR